MIQYFFRLDIKVLNQVMLPIPNVERYNLARAPGWVEIERGQVAIEQ